MIAQHGRHVGDRRAHHRRARSHGGFGNAAPATDAHRNARELVTASRARLAERGKAGAFERGGHRQSPRNATIRRFTSAAASICTMCPLPAITSARTPSGKPCACCAGITYRARPRSRACAAQASRAGRGTRALRGTVERGVRDLLQRGLHAFKALVLDEILDELPRDQRVVREQRAKVRLQRIAAVAGDEAVDVSAVDVGAGALAISVNDATVAARARPPPSRPHRPSNGRSGGRGRCPSHRAARVPRRPAHRGCPSRPPCPTRRDRAGRGRCAARSA